MGVCFSSGPAQHSSSLDRPHSGSASTDSKNVGISRTTSSSTVKRQFSQIATGSIDDEERHLLPRVPLRPLPLPFPPSDEILKWPDLKVFDFEELKSSTNNFMPDTLLGEGGFGKVYKGWLDEDTLAPTIAGSGMVVAIKMLNPESTQGFEQWQTELNLMRRLSHPNLVNLLGYCWDEDQHLLVYEFMLKGSLEDSLFRRNLTPLSWNTRLKIAIGAARGLAFLHASENNVIHRDVKSSNILLDRNYNAKISDFGLARWGLFEGESHNYNPNISDFGLAKFGPSEGQSHVSTRVMGTYGYAAPEYVATGHLSVKSDVYGFGVVLLEILTGMRALNTKRPTGQHNLVEWTKPLLSSKKKLKTIMDAKIVGQYSPKAAFQAAQLTLKCLEHDPKQRPSMKEVLEGLEAIEAIHEKSKESKTRNSYQPPRQRVVRV